MVCIYCTSSTDILNSRPQKRRNSVWRRRHCPTCGATFTTTEQVAYDLSLAFESDTSHIIPFYRDALFISIYEACKHRRHATAEAGELTDTVMQKLLKGYVHGGLIKRVDVIAQVNETLAAFDHAAQIHYAAYHQL
jgi:transcriptional repressor NrdR